MSKIESGIDQLIERVRTEAIDKTKVEQQNLIKTAHEEAQAIIDAAKVKAEVLLKDTLAHINKEKRTLASELELAARDFSLKLSERLREQLFFPVIKESVRATLKEPEFLQQVLERLIVEYVKENPCNLDVLVPKELRVTLAAFFAGAVFDRLDKNSDIRLLDEQGIEGFALIKRGEHYVWDFRAETIALELMRLVEPSLRKYFAAKSSATAQEASVLAVV